MAQRKRRKKGRGALLKNRCGETHGNEKLQQAILRAAAAAGEDFGEEGLVSYLQAQALAVPGSFLTLLGKVLAENEEMIPAPVHRIELVAGVADGVNDINDAETEQQKQPEQDSERLSSSPGEAEA